MRLTKAMLDAFSRDVVKAIPLKSTFDRSAFLQAINKRHYDALPEDVKKFKKKYPGLVPNTSPSFLLEVHHWRLGNPNSPSNRSDGEWIYYCSWNLDELKSVDVQDLVGAYKAHLDELLARDELRIELREKAGVCTTPDQLQKLMPDLVKWMPKEEKRAVALIAPDKTIFNKLKSAGLPVREEA